MKYHTSVLYLRHAEPISFTSVPQTLAWPMQIWRTSWLCIPASLARLWFLPSVLLARFGFPPYTQTAVDRLAVCTLAAIGGMLTFILPLAAPAAEPAAAPAAAPAAERAAAPAAESAAAPAALVLRCIAVITVVAAAAGMAEHLRTTDRPQRGKDIDALAEQRTKAKQLQERLRSLQLLSLSYIVGAAVRKAEATMLKAGQAEHDLGHWLAAKETPAAAPTAAATAGPAARPTMTSP